MLIELNRENCLQLAETLDKETRAYLVDDCIATWDRKDLWSFNPVAIVNDDRKIVNVMFANVEECSTGETILYIQRVFTIPEFRMKGYFKQIFSAIYEKYFRKGCKYLKLFVDKDAYKAYKAMKFIMGEKTQDGKYYFVFIPMIHLTLEYNNFLNSLSPKQYFLSDSAKEFYLEMQRKYNIIDV
jgi:GNAT superfamily N-acetyltransferase